MDFYLITEIMTIKTDKFTACKKLYFFGKK